MEFTLSDLSKEYQLVIDDISEILDDNRLDDAVVAQLIEILTDFQERIDLLIEYSNSRSPLEQEYQ